MVKEAREREREITSGTNSTNRQVSKNKKKEREG
jgi:hypothetical protein